ncbi:hypothetical protein F2P81_002833 [Scophthalmus maximus]|uniref:Uncharacterized protein n=1 Tax=Scophthalmus maximus TaxID=52904 RepID=A0A6A4TSU3_SCOMX|nr:hypothetical protein F2P81_002833 [Scophthalmus maximus]
MDSFFPQAENKSEKLRRCLLRDSHIAARRVQRSTRYFQTSCARTVELLSESASRGGFITGGRLRFTETQRSVVIANHSGLSLRGRRRGAAEQRHLLAEQSLSCPTTRQQNHVAAVKIEPASLLCGGSSPGWSESHGGRPAVGCGVQTSGQERRSCDSGVLWAALSQLILRYTRLACSPPVSLPFHQPPTEELRYVKPALAGEVRRGRGKLFQSCVERGRATS